MEGFKPPYDYRILFEPLPSLGRARNSGWKASTGVLIAFTDDDCYVQQDYAQLIIALFEDDAMLDWFTERILLHNPAHARLTIREDTEA